MDESKREAASANSLSLAAHSPQPSGSPRCTVALLCHVAWEQVEQGGKHEVELRLACSLCSCCGLEERVHGFHTRGRQPLDAHRLDAAIVHASLLRSLDEVWRDAPKVLLGRQKVDLRHTKGSTQ